MSVENLEGEVWKVIDHPSIGCFDNYMVSNMGRVKSLNYRNTGEERLMKQSKDNHSYLYFNLYKKGVPKRVKTHRLVALMFLPNPKNLPCVNHKDENPSNPNVNNLEWCTHQYNMAYGTWIERMVETKKNSDAWKDSIKRQSKQVYQYDQNGKLVNIFQSTKEAAQLTDSERGHISNCCRGKLTNHKGFIWSYTQLTDNQISVLIASIKQNKQVYQYDQNLQLINIYGSLKDASQQNGFSKGCISACCLGKRKSNTAYGYIWSYSPIETKVS